MTRPDIREDILSLAVQPNVVEIVNAGRWELRLIYGPGDAARDAMHAMADRLRAAPTPPAAEAPGQEPVEVKPLEWQTFCSRSGNCEAKTSIGEYVIQSETSGWELYLPGEQDVHSEHATVDCAKAAAQTDYEQRILSALISAPTKQEPVGYVDRLSNPGRISPAEQPELEMPVYAAPPTYADAEAKGFEPVFRDRPTHVVSRRDEWLPCHCWADRDHTIGDEVKHFAAIRSLASPAPKGET